MARLQWNQSGMNKYETGVDHGVLYLPDASNDYTDASVWNGLVSIAASPSGAEPNAHYADNIKYLNLMSAEEFGGTIECFTYPDAWARADGSARIGGLNIGQQTRSAFGLVWRSRVGNEIVGDTLGYKIHMAWNCLASPSEQTHSTVNDTPEPNTFSYEFTSTALDMSEADPRLRPTAYMSVDSTDSDVDQAALKALEDILFGSENETAMLPSPAEVHMMFESGNTGGGGTEGPELP